MRISVMSEDDAELRCISLTNRGSEPRDIELTTYAEVVLSQPAADSAHPAFSKMFVQTEALAERGVLLAARRQREPGQAPLWMVHFSSLQGDAGGGLQFETDRAQFLGRGRDVRNAAAIMEARALSNTAGTVLDPVLALRRHLRVPPGETVQVEFWTGIAASRAQALELADKYRDAKISGRAQLRARAKAETQLRDLGVNSEDAQDLSGYCQPAAVRRCLPARRRRNSRQQQAGAIGVMGPRHLRRSAHCIGQHQGSGRPRSRRAIAAGARVLAGEMLVGGPGHSQ